MSEGGSVLNQPKMTDEARKDIESDKGVRGRVMYVVRAIKRACSGIR